MTFPRSLRRLKSQPKEACRTIDHVGQRNLQPQTGTINTVLNRLPRGALQVCARLEKVKLAGYALEREDPGLLRADGQMQAEGLTERFWIRASQELLAIGSTVSVEIRSRIRAVADVETVGLLPVIRNPIGVGIQPGRR